MEVLQIPLTQDGAYYFDIELDGELFNLQFHYNTRMDRWVMGISDLEGNQLIAGIPLIIGVSLLGQYVKEGLPQGDFYVMNGVSASVNPDEDNLGTETFLYYLTND